MDTLTGMKRTDYCGNFTTEQIGQEVTVYGWAQRQRDLGNLIFIDLRDRTGILQLSGQLDHSFAMIPMQDAQQYPDMGDSISGIAIKVQDVFNANKLVRDAGEVTNNYVYIKSWIGTYGYMYRDIQMMRAIM